MLILFSCKEVNKTNASNIIELEIPNNSTKVIINNKGNVVNGITCYYTYDIRNNELLLGVSEDNLSINTDFFKSKSSQYTKVELNHMQVDSFITKNQDKVTFRSLPNELFLKMILK